MRRLSSLLVLISILAACGGTSTPSDAGALADAPTSDAARDAGQRADTGTPADDTGTGSDAGPDAGADAATPGCAGLLCEDFEGDVLGGGVWTEEAGYDPANHATVQTARVAGGTHAMQAHVNESGGGFAYLTESSTFPALADEVWGRASFYTTVAATSGHSDFVDAVAGDRVVLEVGYSFGNWQLTQYPAPGAENPAGYTTEVPRDRWVCLEWHFQRVAPQIEVFVDGTSLAVYDRADLTVPAMTGLKLGFGNHGATDPTNDAFFDDVVIGPTRIGCP